MLAARPSLTLTAAVAGACAMLPTAVMPLVVGAAIDTAIAAGSPHDLVGWVALTLGLAAVQALASGVLNWASHTLWIHGAVSAERAVVRHAAHLGATLPKRLPTGEVVAMASEDVYDIGNAVETFGRTIGALTSFAVVAFVLMMITPVLGTVALIGVPLAVLGIGPLLRPLYRRKEAQRHQFSEVTAMGADIVAGLRILRGVGGERRFLRRFIDVNDRVRDAGVAVGRIESWLAAAEIALPGLITVVVTWLGARLALDGAISPGELIAFYGASAFLVVPVRTATEAADAVSAARVAASRIDRLLRFTPEFGQPTEPVPLPDGPLSLADGPGGPGGADGSDVPGDTDSADASGRRDAIVTPAGRLTVLPPDRALAERLTGYADSDARVGGVPIADVDRAELRRRVVLVLGDDHLFAGRAAEELAPGDRVPVADAIAAADAIDVIDALPDGFDTVLSERGRSVSGGQRQRLLLARALTLDPDVLVLADPTSAVDAHTEARIVERVAALREGRTTVVLTSSPLWRNAPGAHVATPDGVTPHVAPPVTPHGPYLATPHEGGTP